VEVHQPTPITPVTVAPAPIVPVQPDGAPAVASVILPDGRVITGYAINPVQPEPVTAKPLVSRTAVNVALGGVGFLAVCGGLLLLTAFIAALTAFVTQLIAPTRAALEAAGRPYVIENVAGSEVRKDLRLCGEMFGLGVIMHRYFELGGWATVQPAHPRHRGYVRGWRHGVYRDGPYVAAYGAGGGKATVEKIRAAKGIDWSTDHLRLREALPPAYTQWIVHAFLATLTPALEVVA
jgi:hypothetical protein